MGAVLRVWLNHFPLLKRLLKYLHSHLYRVPEVSSEYVPLIKGEEAAVGARLRDAWHNEAMPIRQRDLVEQQLKQYRSGGDVDVFDVFVNSLRDLPDTGQDASLLEIGCSSGFYSEIIDIAKLPIKYTGCDYAPSFINMARSKYPSLNFAVEDATSLSFQSESFDIVVSGCCLLHIPEYDKGVEEAARVARRYVIFHRTPVVWGQPEKWYRKRAYGVETVEIHFNEDEFLELLLSNGLELITTHTLSEERSSAKGRANRTYVCRKKNI